MLGPGRQIWPVASRSEKVVQVTGRRLWAGRGRGTRGLSAGGGGGPRTPPVRLPARVAAGCRPPNTRHLPSTYGARGRGGAQAGSVPPPPGGTLLPGPPRLGCQVSEGLRRPAPSPLESPRNDVATRQFKKKFNYRDRLWELEQTRSVGGAGKQLRSERAGLDAARGARAPGSGGGERPPGVGNRRKFEESAFFWRGGGGEWKTF